MTSEAENSSESPSESESDNGHEGFRGPQVCKIVGITYRQLDYWARTGLALPSIQPAQGSGSQRLYSFEDLVELKLIKNLLDTGVSLQRVRQAIINLRELGHDSTGVTLVGDGNSVYAYHTADEVIDLLRRGQGVFAIAIDPVKEQLMGSVSELNPMGKSESEAITRPSIATPPSQKAQGED